MLYTIENSKTGVVLGIYAGNSESEALNAMARDAGYKNYSDLLSSVPGASRSDLVLHEGNRISEGAESLERLVEGS